MLISNLALKDDVTTFAKLEPTNRIQHVVCEAKNEVRCPSIMYFERKKMKSKPQFNTR